MKHYKFIIFSIFVSLAFVSENISICEKWNRQSFEIFLEISKDSLNISDSIALKTILNSRTSAEFKRIDSLFRTGNNLIYIIEEFDISMNTTNKIEKYFSRKEPSFDTFMIAETGHIKTIQVPNFIVKNGSFIESNNYVDPFNLDNLKIIQEHWKSIDNLSYVTPIIDTTFVTPGCTGTAIASKRIKKEMEIKYAKPIKSNIYRIETLIDKNKIRISFQIPKEMKPIIHVKSITF